MKILSILFALSLSIASFAQKPYLQIGPSYYFSSGQKQVQNFQHGLGGEAAGGIKISQYIGLGAGFGIIKFKDPGKTYVPLFADLRVTLPGKVQPFLSLQPGYGIYHNNFYATDPDPGSMYASVKQKGGFYLGIAPGLVFPKAHLFVQAKYGFYRFTANLVEGGFPPYNSNATRGIFSLETGFNL